VRNPRPSVVSASGHTARGHNFSLLATVAARPPLRRSLISFSPSHHSRKTLTRPTSSGRRLNLLPATAGLPNPRHQFLRQPQGYLSGDTTPHHTTPHHTTPYFQYLWAHSGHAESLQRYRLLPPTRTTGRLPFRVPAGPESAKHFTHFVHTPLYFIKVDRLVLAAQRSRTLPNREIAER
jgi:hypothetical protein